MGQVNKTKKLSKPKVFIDKEGQVTIVFGKDHDRHECGVYIVHDRGKKQATNMFGITPARFVFHSTSAYGDSGYSSDLENWSLDNEEVQYFLIVKNRHPRSRL